MSEIEKDLISLSFLSIAAAPPSISCFPGKIQSHNSNLIWLRFTESWFNSISISMEHLLNTKFTFLCHHTGRRKLLGARHVKHGSWGSWQGSGYHQILNKDVCHWLPYTGIKWWQESQREAYKTYFPLVYETFSFQNGLRSDRNTTRHAESLNVEGLQCVL